MHRPSWSIWTKTKQNSVALVRKQNILTTVCLPLVSEVSANFWEQREPRGQRDRSLQPYSRFSRLELLFFIPSSSLVVLTRLSGLGSRPSTPLKNMVAPGIKSRILDPKPGALTTRPQRQSIYFHTKKKTKLSSMVWVRKRTIPTERPPLVGEVIANFCG
jgi:hypothetical protein